LTVELSTLHLFLIRKKLRFLSFVFKGEKKVLDLMNLKAEDFIRAR